MADLKSTLQALVADAQKASFYDLAEMQVQSDYVLKVLEALGWESRDWKLGQSQEVDTGKMPDIVLHDKNGYAVFVMDCKDASGPRKLDGSYFSGKARKSFVDKLFDYCDAEGICWGMLTNFVEWRLYSVQQKRLYLGKKFAIHALLWPKAERRDYVDLLSEEGLAFLSLFQRKVLCERKGKVDTDPVYYPQEEEIKAQFFARLRAWRGLLRDELFRTYGERFDKQEIDLFTQKILDRVIFMDVCHDKGIIGPDHLRAILHSKGSKYGELKHRFRDMDERFNTELFMLHEIDRFEVSDETLIPILNELILTDFSRISVHIIGEVYENYLGEILRVSKKKGLRVQEHKEQAKRKEHGIYYTPEYIVDYIVKNTLGELLKEVKTEAELRRIRVLDPACGSGSFLIRAFDLFYEAYQRIKKKGQLEAFKDFEIKKAILQNNLFGVDLDERAVEIAKLNLMLKALEGVIWEELKGRKLLPNLNLNIRCGNSLISGHRLEEQYEGELALGDRFDREIGELVKLRKQFYKETEDEEKEGLLKKIRRDEEVINRKLNANLKGFFKVPEEQRPLNFQVVFPEVFRDGGFDGVIGNPPWGAGLSQADKIYLTNRFPVVPSKLKDSYLYFILQAINLSKEKGYVGFIIPNTWLLINNAKDFRRALLAYRVREIIDHGDGVFRQATVESSTIVLIKEQKVKADDKCHAVRIKKGTVVVDHYLPKQFWLGDSYCRIILDANKDVQDLLKRISIKCERFDANCSIIWGIKPYQEGYGSPPQTRVMIERRVYHSDYCKGPDWKPLLIGSNVDRYIITFSKNLFIHYGKWLMYPSDERLMLQPKILLRQTSDVLRACYDDKGYYCQNSVFIVHSDVINLKYLLALLNSKLFSFIYKTKNPQSGKAFAEIKPSAIKELPIRTIDFKDKNDKAIFDQLVDLVNKMMSLKRAKANDENQVRMAALDKEIDQLVYRLYGVTTKEIEAIGGSAV